MKPRLQEKYEREIVAEMTKEFGYANKMEAPKLDKIIIYASVTDAVKDAKVLNTFAEEMSLITGQKVMITRAKKAIANFKLREGVPIGIRVTLRRARMYEFLDRFINIALPRVRDFKGVSTKSFDGRGNYAMGVLEHMIFPELDPNRVEKSRGFNINFATTAKTDPEAAALLKGFGMPFRR